MRFWILLSLLPLAMTQAAQAETHDWAATSTTAMAKGMDTDTPELCALLNYERAGASAGSS